MSNQFAMFLILKRSRIVYMSKNSEVMCRQWSYERPSLDRDMPKGSPLVASTLILMMLASTCLVATAQAEENILDEIEIMHTLGHKKLLQF